MEQWCWRVRLVGAGVAVIVILLLCCDRSSDIPKLTDFDFGPGTGRMGSFYRMKMPVRGANVNARFYDALTRYIKENGALSKPPAEAS